MSDLISREDAIDALAYFDEKDPLGHTAQQIIMAFPSVQPQISVNAVNLCETCKYDFPECPKDSNVIFGDGKGSDNVCACSSYEVYVPPISKREWYQKGYEAGVKSVQPQRMRGRWKRVLYGSEMSWGYCCSECGLEDSAIQGYWNFCPNCGADMRETE